ncbi:MAG: iron ABC transporter permease [Bacteroidales bacterium]|nr:iron ABC transporter permease [Bacteroidales bacterium]
MKNAAFILASIAILCLVVIISLNVGESFEGDMADVVFWNLRVPRVLMAVSCGAMLSLCGCVMQGMFRNPLVEPYTMGVSGGAMVGVGCAFALGAPVLAVDVMAFVGALMSMFIVLLVRKIVGGSVAVMLLAGVMVSFAASSVSTLVMYMSTRENIMHILSWSMGSFEAVDISRAYIMAAVAVVCVVVSPLLGNLLNVLSLGEGVARHLGVDVRFYVAALFVVSSLVTSLCVASVGVVAFVGMVVPHLMRSVVGSEHKLLLPLSGIAGGAFLVLCDVLSRVVVYPLELPAGIFSGIVGGVVFIVLLSRKWLV